MVEFSKMIDLGKSSGTGSGSKPFVRTGGLSMRGLSNRGTGREDAEENQVPEESAAAIEKRRVLYTQAAEYLGLAFSSVQADRSFSLDPGFRILEKIVDSRTPIDALFLKAIHDEDSYDLLVSPSVNVSIYAIKMAENLGFSKTRQIEIGMVGLLHDIGMAKIPEELVYKKTLTSDEFSVFKARPSYGYEILKDFEKEHAYLAECALQIHERVDGSGYPSGLHADEIHEYAQIIGLVDIYEALIHSRPQREKIPHFYAVKEVIKTGKDKFQQRFLKALLNTFSIFPLNSYVRLNSGAIGRVIRTYPDQPMRPKIQIIYDSQSKRVLTERLISLPEHSLLYIVDSVSEQELVDISEASYLVAKTGRKIPASEEPEAAFDDDAEEIETGEEGPNGARPVARLTAARAAKPRGRMYRQLLLILAGLFLAAGLIWQFWFQPSFSDTDAGSVAAPSQSPASRPPDKMKARMPAKKEIPPETTVPPVAATAKQSMESWKASPDTPAADRIGKPENPASQEAGIAQRPAMPPPKAAAPAITGISGTRSDPVESAPAEKRLLPESGRYPYSILLASFRKVTAAKAAIAAYKAKGLAPFWVEVDLGEKGTWYRVFNGHYIDGAQARATIELFHLDSALVKKTRYAAWIGGFNDEPTLTLRRSELADLGFSTYVTTDSEGPSQLYVGAFLTVEGARDQHASLKNAGIESRIVER